MRIAATFSSRRHGFWLDAKSPEVTLYFVLADDGHGVAVADAVLVGEPVRPLLAAQEGGTGLEVKKAPSTPEVPCP